jgi:hypothetical protein
MTRAALYLRVSTHRQAEKDLSIPDQRRQLEAWCKQHAFDVVAEYVEPGATATDDRRPQFQRMMEDATRRDRPFNVIFGAQLLTLLPRFIPVRAESAQPGKEWGCTRLDHSDRVAGFGWTDVAPADVDFRRIPESRER